LASFKNHPLVPHLGKGRSPICTLGGGEFLKVFITNNLQCRRRKKQEKFKPKQDASSSMATEQPSKECQDFLVELILKFYEAESNMILKMKYVRYKEESISKFKMEMQQRMTEALHNPRWMDET
jgi:hypothetical protein